MGKRILAFETSCDDTGVAIYDSELGLVAHVLNSQVSHQQYGGVVPELASRDHTAHIVPLLEHVLAKSQMSLADIHAIAYTKGPGLVGALLVGATFARSLAYAQGIPAIGVHHLEAHLLAPMLEAEPPNYPFLVLLVSGGHTQLVAVKAPFQYQLLGETLDDAVGEAFDKTAKLMGLPYPGGPALAELATMGRLGRWRLPRPMTNRPGLDLSFSGLKTQARVTYLESEQREQDKADLAIAFEAAICDTLRVKCQRALAETGLPALVVAGGVAANKRLRATLQQLAQSHGVKLYFPRIEFCTDNAAMVAYAGMQRWLNGESESLSISVRPRWPLEALSRAD